MLPLLLERRDRPLSVLALGAHCDDVEIGAGGLLLLLARQPLALEVCLLTGAGSGRDDEARAAARAVTPDVGVEVHGLPDGRLPAHWDEVKDVLSSLAGRARPDVVLAPQPADAHQDHRLIAELVPQVWRDVLVLGYEIPKWDGDLGRPNTYVALPPEVLEAKWRLLDEHYASQRGRNWWDREVVVGLARLRGMECRARYAEAFTVTKALLSF
ncbi:MAG TPA: PIG-L family deacetylase [Mycobacteriales bacterium]|jgi:LmbE family N-acetylglucosaminyl deacetylase|nr:PIG-L family deacetylase [Mycobacteriales bacterium]